MATAAGLLGLLLIVSFGGAVMDGSIGAPPDEYMCRVEQVIDGDTFHCQAKDGSMTKIRMAYIDAPSLTEEYGDKAKDKLNDLISKKKVKIKPLLQTDRYGTIAVVTYNSI